MVKSILLKLASKSSIFYILKRKYQRVRDKHYMSQTIDDKLVVFEAFRSSKYVDSPKAIYEYMLANAQYKDYKFIWVFEHPEKYKYIENDRTKIVKHESHAHYMAFARAKYWVVNGWIPLRFMKKSGQTMLQCWHGTPLKRLRHDIVDSANTDHRAGALRNNDLDAERFDYFISPSRFASEKFTSAFNLKALGKEDIMIETGYPRNDYLITYDPSDIISIKQRLGIPDDKKVLLYAPTWRDDQQADEGGYKYQLPVDFNKIRDALQDDYVILFRAHNLVSNSFDFDAYKGFIYDVSSIDDVNELYIISDVLMTDYSSVFFDYANLKRPIIFYMYDREHYAKDLRGFYIDLDELPGDIVETEDQAISCLKDLTAYNQKQLVKYEKFNAKFNYLDDGQASARVVDRVF